MWFRNLAVYVLKEGLILTREQLADQLARGAFVKCPSNQPSSRGWVAPHNDGALVYSQNRQYLIALQIEERQLPAAVINQEAAERAKHIEAQQGYAPGRKQMKELRERVAEELLPRAFTRQRKIFAWIDPDTGWFVVDGNLAQAEAVIEHLRHCLDDFPLQLLHTQRSPQSAMADWLAGGAAPAGYTIDRDCELKGIGEEKAAVRYTRHPLDGAEIEAEVKAHLAAGKLPTRLALTWNDRISFVLDEKLGIKRLAFLDVMKEEADQAAETAADQFDANFALMTGELQRFLPALVAELGGEVRK